MILLLDVMAIIVPLIITVLVYIVCYQLSIKRYVRKIKNVVENGEHVKAVNMKRIAMSKQPNKMRRLLADIDITEISCVEKHCMEMDRD